ncbi:MAG: hypothetical protein ABIT07_04575 [Ferruginibacter sp.]
MKKILSMVIAGLFIISFSCKKVANEFSIPPGDLNTQVNASVAVSGDTIFNPFNFTAAGNNTVFTKNIYSNGDTVITILGGTYKGDIQITLGNINLPGTYPFKTSNTSSQFSICTYVIGNALLGPVFLFYSTPSNGIGGGTVPIESLTTNYIKGSFIATCSGSKGTVQITNGIFKGTF